MREIVKHSCRRLDAVVEKKYDPRIKEGAAFRCRDDCSFIVKVMLCKVTDCCEDFSGLAAINYVGAAPYFVLLRVGLNRKSCHDSKVVTTTFQRCEQIYKVSASLDSCKFKFSAYLDSMSH